MDRASKNKISDRGSDVWKWMEPSLVPNPASGFRFLPDYIPALVLGFPSWDLGSFLERPGDSMGKGLPRLEESLSTPTLRVFIPVADHTQAITAESAPPPLPAVKIL